MKKPKSIHLVDPRLSNPKIKTIINKSRVIRYDPMLKDLNIRKSNERKIKNKAMPIREKIAWETAS